MNSDPLPNLPGGAGAPPPAAAVNTSTPAAVAPDPAGGSATPSGTAGASGPSDLRFAFTGVANDYFRIWIVNLLLTLVTVGLWSPWAKVRKRRYLYGHTWFAGANFEYHANPVAILRGRLIAVAAIGVYWVCENLVPNARPWLLALLLCGAPWIIARSLTFNTANSSHRGIRFRFSGTAREVALAIWPAALCLVAYVAVGGYSLDIIEHPFRYFAEIFAVTVAFCASYPYAMAKFRQLMIARSGWGNQNFHTTLRVRNVYSIYAIGVAVCLIPLLGTIVAGIAGGMAAFALGKNYPLAAAAFGGIFAMLAWVSVLIVWIAYNRSRMTNLLLNTSGLSDLARLQGTLSARALAKLYAVNLIAILVSGGLLIPWAVMRLTRYRVQAMSVKVPGPPTTVAARVTQNPSATGEELGEMFGFDLAL